MARAPAGVTTGEHGPPPRLGRSSRHGTFSVGFPPSAQPLNPSDITDTFV
ncbi:MAG TPA: hypothetical protein VEY88_05385 [Archangium sp.]|nr:hypothetical protein [Archangium sp.]